jgi:hypothetical protein
MMVPGKMILALVAVVVVATLPAPARSQQTKYPKMAPLDQYLIADRNEEIALARTGAPPSISANAEVMVLGKNGYEVAVPGTNHFVCLVERSWDAATSNPGFWNPKIRGPNCFNEAAVRSFLPIAFMKTRLALSGKSSTEIDQAMQAAFSQKKLPALEPGAMCYMLSKQGYLNDAVRNWHPHLMFFVPVAMAKTWGANLAGSPVLSSDDPSDRLTIFMVPVGHWSDGTADGGAGN